MSRWPISTHVAGMSYYDTKFIKEGPVQLEREPTNKHDPNAIKVVQSGIHIGYVPKNMTFFVREGCVASIRPPDAFDRYDLQQRFKWILVIDKPEFSIGGLLKRIYSVIHT